MAHRKYIFSLSVRGFEHLKQVFFINLDPTGSIYNCNSGHTGSYASVAFCVKTWLAVVFMKNSNSIR